MNGNWKYGWKFVAAMSIALAVAGCIRDDVDDCPEPGSGYGDDVLAMSISLSLTSSQPATRASWDHTDGYESDEAHWENYIDVRNPEKFAIYVFDSEGKFLFTPKRYEILPVTDTNGVTQWIATFPAPTQPGDEYNEALKGDKTYYEYVTEVIEQQGCKIAVCANWPSRVQFDYGDPISKFSHCTDDATYSGRNNTDSRDLEGNTIKDADGNSITVPVYERILKDGKMGMYLDWVKTTYASSASASDGCRQLGQTISEAPYYTNKYWKLWNIGGIPDNAVSDPKIKENALWEKRNAIWRTENALDTQPEGTEIADETDFDGLVVHIAKDQAITLHRDDNGYEALRLPMITGDTNTPAGKETAVSRLTFMAEAAGTVRLRVASATGANASVKIVNEQDDPETKKFNNIQGLTDVEFEIKVPEDPHPVHIYAENGAIDVYEVEFMKNTHIYEAFRHGIDAKDQPIPMYGVQNFKPIGEGKWQRGVLFNLSGKAGGYEGKNVSLLRSVAKVELLIPAQYEQPYFVAMRCINRHARCEPVDVYTPTDQIWEHESGAKQEFASLMDFGPFYLGGKPRASSSKLNENNIRSGRLNMTYQQELDWFYLSWKYDNYDAAGNISDLKPNPLYASVGVDEEHLYVNEDGTNNRLGSEPRLPDYYPHVFNARINRSDYSQFIYTGTKGNYYRYIAYVPDKHVTDPNTHGRLNDDNGKTPHIELRFWGAGQDDLNLDDNKCYRIYFIQGGASGKENRPEGKNDRDTQFNGYEDWEKKLYTKSGDEQAWPIVRNHVYKFTVTSIGGFDNNTTATVEAEVVRWETPAPIEITFD